MKIQLSEHFTYNKLLRFVLPSVIMMIFTSIYGVVDGIFVSNFAGSVPFAAINLIIPFTMIFGAVGFMLGTGGCALVAKTMGEGNDEKANQYFSMIIYANIILGIVLSITGILVIRPVARMMGASELLLEDAVLYGRILLAGNTLFMLQNMFQAFFAVAEKPKIGLCVTVGAGVTNMILDFLLVGVLRLGVGGAAAATATSYLIGGMIPFIYFAKKNTSRLRLVRTKFYMGKFLRSCANGSSEMMTNLSMSVVNMLYNIQLMKFAAESGVAAYGVIMYVNFVFVSAFIGYSIGSAPIIGFHYGADNRAEMRNVLKKSLVIIFSTAAIMFVLAEVLAGVLAGVFVGYDMDLLNMTENGFRIFSVAFLFMGFNIFGSAFFTALNNGIISAFISFLRTLLFQITAVLILPIIFGLNGIWMSVVAAELLATAVTAFLIIKYKKKYGY